MGLFFDYGCQLWRTDLAGDVVGLPMANDCYDARRRKTRSTDGWRFTI